MTEPTNGLTPPNEAGKFDEHVAATIRTAVDEWHTQNDPADEHGVSMPEYIRRALVDAGLLGPLADADRQRIATAMHLKPTADVDSIVHSAENYVDIVRNFALDRDRVREALLPILREHSLSKDDVEGDNLRAGFIAKVAADVLRWYAVEVERLAAERDEALAALKKQQATLADAVSPYREMLGAIWLYVDWRYVSKQLTTEQKELWADAVDAFGEPQDGKAERWWRDDFVDTVPPNIPFRLNRMSERAHEIVRNLRANGFDAAQGQQRQVLNLAEEVGEFVGAYRRWAGQARRSGTAEEMYAELADVVITAFVTAEEFGVDLETVIGAKLRKVFSRGWREPNGAAGAAR